MRLVLISDTHLPHRGRDLPDPVWSAVEAADAVIAQVVASIDATLTTVRTAVEELAELDPVSQDVAIEIARGLDKDRWFLFAHLAAK